MDLQLDSFCGSKTHLLSIHSHTAAHGHTRDCTKIEHAEKAGRVVFEEVSVKIVRVYQWGQSDERMQIQPVGVTQCKAIAGELGLNVALAKRAGLLHDIGKAIDHQTDGTHTQLGVDIAKRYNEHPFVINSIAAHHEDEEAESPYAVLVAAGDTISASRPGARREMLETYIKRMTQLEEIGDSFKGVQKTFAIQAGREVRIIVMPSGANDQEANILARDVAKRIEKEVTYPGEIKVTVVRETRFTEFAR